MCIYHKLRKIRIFLKKTVDKRIDLCYNKIVVREETTKQTERQGKTAWGFSSAGRASALQAEGHRFEPYSPHHLFGPVVQLVRTPPCHGGGREFESHPGRYASVAQLVEQGTENPRVVGSIPTGSTKCGFSSSGRAPPCQGGGSEFEPRNPLHMYRGNIPGIVEQS